MHCAQRKLALFMGMYVHQPIQRYPTAPAGSDSSSTNTTLNLPDGSISGITATERKGVSPHLEKIDSNTFRMFYSRKQIIRSQNQEKVIDSPKLPNIQYQGGII